MIPIAGKAELTNFSFLFWSKAKDNLADSHIWFSIFQRPAKSSFTRVQRLSCCISLIFCSMCASIAWYGTQADSDQSLKAGPVTISLAGVYVGIMSSAMTFPINILIVMLFRMSKPRPQKNKPIETTLVSRKKTDDDGKGDEGKQKETAKEWWEKEDDEKDGDDYYIEEELKNQKEYLDTGDGNKKNLKKTGELTMEDTGLIQVANIPLPKDLKASIVQIKNGMYIYSIDTHVKNKRKKIQVKQ